MGINRNTFNTKVQIAGIVVLLVAAWGGFFASEGKKIKKVARVNGSPITKAELQHWMLLNKAEVYNYYYRKYEANPDKKFWVTQFNGRTPLETLRDRSLKDVVRNKIKQQLAANLGIDVIQDFSELMEERLRVNKIRKKRAELGKVIYGPVTFTPRTYIARVLDKLVRESKNILSATRFKISYDEMKSLYEDYKIQQRTEAVEKDSVPDIASFSNYKPVKQSVYTEKEYEKLINRLLSNSYVKINKEIYQTVDLAQ